MHPDALFHHDDWGSQRSTFLSPEMFKEFILPAYKKIYGYWKANGVEIIVHHSDSYAATLVPDMIECGIDVFQGAIQENNIPQLIQQYGGKISIMGGLNNGIYDRSDWNKQQIYEGAKQLVESCGKHYLIPGLTMGGPESTYPGVYQAVDDVLDQLSREMF
jgi:uroporphyrinogen-III decarboxylase